MGLIALYVVMVLPIVIFAGAVIAWSLLVYPKQRDIAVENALILAAHSDDCVITAGEYGIECLRRGKILRIVYMTCGADRADSQLALTRRMEAERAWSRANLAPELMTFIDAPQSPVHEEQSRSVAWRERIADTLRAAVAGLPPGAVIILPAAAERHIDHRTLRELALAVIAASGRTDLVVYEAPGYSNYISLVCNPFRALRVLLGFLPLAWRIGPKITLDAPFGYYATFGRGAVRLPADEQRLMLKRAMLSMFTSQGGERVSAAFGRPDVLRRIKPDEAARGPARPFGLKVGQVVCTGSTLLFAGCLLLAAVAVVAAAVVALTR